MTTDASAQQSAQRFGTLLGVFTPSVLTILGLIMYLRFGWVVGNLGLPVTLLVVLLASSITFITALSASAVATNMTVGVGGEYYMISRGLGLELGSAIGIPLFLCRTLSITFYSFGLVEAILAVWPARWGEIPSAAPQILAAAIIITITLVSGKSAELALKLQIPIMVAVGVSLVALAIGALADGTRIPEFGMTLRTAPKGFWYVFAVFFPAVTGFTAGIGMSGDLKDPRHSIPRGTLAAVAVGTAVYLLVPVLMAVTTKVSPEELAVPGVVWTSIAIFGSWLVFPGLWGAILSSAFGSVLGGPRVLQALAADGLAPSFLARLSATGQPTVATWVSGAIALAAVVLGGLNAVAQFVTILFLTLYVTINLASALESLVGDPSYRPTIRVPWYVSLLGSVGAIVVMFLISPWACLAAVVLESALYVHLRRRAMRKRWGDVRAGMWVALARWALLKLRHHELDPRNWRPQILLFAGDPGKRAGLVRLASWFNQDRGVVTVCRLVVGELEKTQRDRRDAGGDGSRTRGGRHHRVPRGGCGAGFRRRGDQRGPGQWNCGAPFQHRDVRVVEAQGAARVPAPNDARDVLCTKEHHHRQAQLGPRAGDRETHRHLVGWSAEQRGPHVAAGLPAAAQPRVEGCEDLRALGSARRGGTSVAARRARQAAPGNPHRR